MTGAKISRDTVLAAIYSPLNRRRIIWTPSTTLAAVGIEQYPHSPKTNYLRMRKVLEGFRSEGRLALRPNLHSQYMSKETAYERVRGGHPA